MPPSASQIDRLGDALRQDAAAPDALRREYDAYRVEFADALADVQQQIQLVSGVAAVGRLKTFEAVAAKMRRQRTRLSQVADIAGCRVVVSTLTEQELLRRQIRAAWVDCRIRDYRESPQFGYRAVHAIVRARGRLVEIQIRTTAQNAWANFSEAIAYGIDMSIKYGGGPEDVRTFLESLAESARQSDLNRDRLRELAATLEGLRSEVATRRQSGSTEQEIQSWLDSYDEIKREIVSLDLDIESRLNDYHNRAEQWLAARADSL